MGEKETTLKELEANLWETADSLRNESSLTSQMYYMPVLGIIFLRHATYRFRMVEKALVEDPTWPRRKGVPRPVVPDDFATKSAMFVPEKARYDYLLNLPGDQDICKAVNDAMTLIEDVQPILKGILPKTYSSLGPSLLRGLLRNFADEKIPRLGDDAFGRFYEYFRLFRHKCGSVKQRDLPIMYADAFGIRRIWRNPIRLRRPRHRQFNGGL